jgi:general secretion pathway protein G
MYYEFPSAKVPNGAKPAIWSSGPNKQSEDGSGDDINNWTSQ